MMFKIDKLTLMTGVDIFIPEYEVKIHQPNIHEIAILGEEKFFLGLNIFMIDIDNFKTMLLQNLQSNSEEEKLAINNLTEFEIVLFLLNTDNQATKMSSRILNLILSDYTFEFDSNQFRGFLKNKENNNILEFDNELYFIIKDIVNQIFILDKFFNTTSLYNPSSEKANEIAKKLKKSKDKIRAQKPLTEQQSVFANMISILGIIGYTVQSLNNLTIYQLYNQFERYTLRMSYDQSVQAAIAGAKVDIVDWFKEI